MALFSSMAMLMSPLALSFASSLMLSKELMWLGLFYEDCPNPLDN
jgi:hypothetical protein